MNNKEFILGIAETKTIEKTKTQITEPTKYAVVLLNDDYTTWQFVVATLIRIFNKNEQDANAITDLIHKKGEGVCGVYSKEIAESKVQASLEFSKINKQPLRTIMRKVT